MRCDKYRQYVLGEMPSGEFESHSRTCKECSEAQSLDEIIARKARDLPVPETAPGLWKRIVADLVQERERRRPWTQRLRIPLVEMFEPRRRVAWGVVTVCLVVIGFTALYVLRPAEPGPQPRNLLTAEALDRIEAMESQYEQAIAELEGIAIPLAEASDLELLLRYRDRLETIDSQIRRCKAVLAEDGANAHVRRYLLGAYQDKKETLTELMVLAER